MGRGLLAGIFWGGLVGLAVILVSDRVMDRRELSLPQPAATPVEVPAGTEFDQARPESDPVVPETDAPPVADVATGVVAPEDVIDTPPAFDTSSLEVPTPSVEGPGGLAQTPEIAEDVEVEVTGPGATTLPATDSPALPQPDAPAAAPEAATDAPAEPQPGGEDSAAAAPVPVEDTPPEQPVAPAADEGAMPAPMPTLIETDSAALPDTAEAPAGSAAPEAEDSANAILRPDGGDSQFFKPVEEITDRAPEVETGRLPRIGAAPETEDSALPGVIRLEGETDPPVAAAPGANSAAGTPPAGTGAALTRYRMAFERTDRLPLMAIVLVHAGDAALSADDLAGVPATVAIAVDAGQAGARAIAAAYRAQGREVVMIPSLPEGAEPQDVEVALRVNFETVPEAVAVMDSIDHSFQTDRAAVAQVVDVIADTGHGLITFPRGLNTAMRQAERTGIPAALIFRDIDGSAEDGEQIRRSLDRAAFRARPDEAIVLVGRMQRPTLAALAEWTLGNRAATVTLAPVSVALGG